MADAIPRRRLASDIAPRRPAGPPRRSRSSTGWQPPALAGGRCCRSTRRTSTGRRTHRRRPSRHGRGCWLIPTRGWRRPRCARSSSAIATGSATGPTTPAAMPSRSRCGSTVSGRRSEPTLPAAACGSSATSRSTSRRVAATTWRIRASSCRAPPSPGRRLTRSTTRGQKWGNPLYDWDALAREGYRWWIERLRRVLGLVDVFRIDHFRGFAGLLDGADDRAGRARAAAGHGSRRRRVPGGRGRARAVARDRRGSRSDHARRGAVARRARLPGHGRPGLGLRGAAEQSAPARESSLQPGHVRPRRTTPTRSPGTSRARPRGICSSSALSSRAALAWCRCRTCSGSAPRHA